MIVINAIIEDLKIRPEKELTSEEQLTVTSSVCNGIEYIYYQNDEPIEPIEEII
jgi:hypothetical protein